MRLFGLPLSFLNPQMPNKHIISHNIDFLNNNFPKNEKIYLKKFKKTCRNDCFTEEVYGEGGESPKEIGLGCQGFLVFRSLGHKGG